MLAVDYENIPRHLIRRPQWLCWRLETRKSEKGDEKPTKVPYNARTGGKAKSNDPSTWCDFNRAGQAARRGDYDGVGFAFAAGDGLCGIDLDHVVNAQTGELDPKAAEILQQFAGTYCELSPSGTGLRLFCIGKPKRTGKNTGQPKWAEIYDHTSPRYLTVTGHHWMGTANELTEQQAALDWLHEAYFAQAAKPAAARPQQAIASAYPSHYLPLEDGELIRKAIACKSGTVFQALYSGNIEAHGDDHSAADLAFCNLLAFWTGHDAAQMDRIFRTSGLMRDKWDKKHRADGATYGQMTVEAAQAACRSIYQPRGDRPGPVEEVMPPRSGGDQAPPADAGAGGESGEYDRRPMVRIGGDRLVTAMTTAEQLLFEGPEPPFYERGGILVWLKPIDQPRDLQKGAVTREPGTMVIEPLTAGWLRRRMMQACRFERYDSRLKLMIPVNLPKEYPESYMDGGEWNVPILKNIVILNTWESVRPMDFPNYPAGTWGPEAAESLLAADGRNWVLPTFLQCQEDTAVCQVTMVQP